MLALLISSACLSNVEPEIVRADAYSGSDTVGFSIGDFLIVYLSPDVNDTPEWINEQHGESQRLAAHGSAHVLGLSVQRDLARTADDEDHNR